MKKPKKRGVIIDESLLPSRRLERPEPTPEERRQLRRLHDKRVAVYKRQVERVGEAMLRCVLRAYASYDAAVKVNEKLLDQFGLDEDSGVDLALVQGVLKQALRVEVARIIVSNTRLTDADRNAMAERIIARMLPTLDSLAPTDRSKLSRRDLEEIVKTEAKSITQAVSDAVKPRQAARPSKRSAVSGGKK